MENKVIFDVVRIKPGMNCTQYTFCHECGCVIDVCIEGDPNTFDPWIHMEKKHGIRSSGKPLTETPPCASV